MNFDKDSLTEDFINTLSSFFLEPHILKSTRITNHSSTLIDNIFFNSIEYQTVSGNLLYDLTDHLPNFLIIERFAPRYCRITPLMRELHWLPIRQRIHFKMLLFTFKAIHGIAPLYIQDLVQVKSQGAYNLPVLLDAPSIRTKVTLGDRAFQVAAPKLWNSLPSELRLINNIDIFKRHLKTYLFKVAFD